jgi:hypothetical protein
VFRISGRSGPSVTRQLDGRSTWRVESDPRLRRRNDENLTATCGYDAYGVPVVNRGGSGPSERTVRQMTKALSGPGSRRTARAASRTGAPAVDRYLCAFAHRSPRFARYVLRELARPGLRALPPACGVDLVALIRHACLAAGRWKRTRIFVASVVSTTIVLALTALALGDAVMSVLVLLASGPTVFVSVFVNEYRLYRISSTLASHTVDVRATAPPVNPELEASLDAVMTANVVVFTGGDPFVGWGTRLRDGWQINVDASRPGTDQQGNPRIVKPFEPSDLHKAMTLAVRAAGIPDLAVHNRLFVSGMSADRVPGLVPDPMGRPGGVLDPTVLRKGIDRPKPDARTYLCIDKTSWGGELVVTLYVRAATVRNDLFIECHAYVLLPLRNELTSVDHTPTSSVEVLWASLVAAVRKTLPTCRRCVSELVRMAQADHTYDRRRRADMRAVRRNRPLDRGAGISLRAAAAADERVFLFAYTDEEMYLNVLQRRVLDAIHDFLENHGVDTADFNKKQTNIITNHTYTIGNIQAQQAQIGNQNNMTNPTNNPGGPGAVNPTPAPPPWAGP